MWVWSGFVLSLTLAAAGWWRSTVRTRTFYEGDVYGMDSAGHRKYALGFTLGASLFLVELVWPGWMTYRRLGGTIPADWFIFALLAYTLLTGILYGATFLRGASGEDE